MQRNAFNKRKFNKFCDPTRWVLAERTFEASRKLRATKLFCEDYSSSSEDEGYWDNEINQYLTQEVEEIV